MAPISTRLPGSRSEIEASTACQVWWLLPIDYSFVSGRKRTHCRSCGPFLLLEDHKPWPLGLPYAFEATHGATMVLTVFQAIVSLSIHAIWTIETNLCHGFCFLLSQKPPHNGTMVKVFDEHFMLFTIYRLWVLLNTERISFSNTITSFWSTYLSKGPKSLSPEKDYLILTVSWVMIRGKKSSYE